MKILIVILCGIIAKMDYELYKKTNKKSNYLAISALAIVITLLLKK